MKRINVFNYILLMIFVIAGLIVLGIFTGPVRIAFSEIFSERYFDILRLRFFRMILAVIAGAGLSLSGMILQGVLRNPLAEPYVLGVSSGSSLGAIIALIFLPAALAVNGLAFLGGILTIILVYNLARIDSKLSSENMIISGVLVNALFSSILMFFIAHSSSSKIHSIMWWLLGNLQIYRSSQLVISGAVIAAGIIFAMIFSKELNALSLGDEEAMHLGVDIGRIKKLLLAISALVTSVIVSMCGIIGFVGLMIPHITRKLVGPDHRTLVPASVLTGAAFLLLCDLVSRIVMAPQEMPIGVITAFVGVPFFIYVLRNTRKVYFK